MSEYVIEKGVPTPPPRHHGSGTIKYPFHEMEVGDSFHAPAEEAKRARLAATGWGKRNGRKFVGRKNGDGIRIWRIA